MRDKELRLALVCYGGISLAVYMHGITKELWRLLSASRAFCAGDPAAGGSQGIYRALFEEVAAASGVRLRVLTDILAGASAGGINSVFLARAIDTGESLDPLTELWLRDADVERLIDPAQAPGHAMTKFWARPLAWLAAGSGKLIDETVEAGAREEVHAKLDHFVRSRWFEPPFGGERLCHLILDAFDAMAAAPAGPRLLPPGQPLDLFVTVTDFTGHPERLRLHSPAEVVETEHRLVLSFASQGRPGERLAAAPDLTFAARATSSFPGAFPPFTVAELDRVIAARGAAWPSRDAFLARAMPRHVSALGAERAVLIDGSVLANAPFRPAIAALRERPARRQVDRRFVVIDPAPGFRFALSGEIDGVPGFFQTLIGALSEIPRQQPIRDSLETLSARSARIERMNAILEQLRPEVEGQVERLFGYTFLLDYPTPKRLAAWRRRAQAAAATRAGYGQAAYGLLKLEGVIDRIAQLLSQLAGHDGGEPQHRIREAVAAAARTRGAFEIGTAHAGGAAPQAIGFLRAFDISFRIRRLRLLVRRIGEQDGDEELAEVREAAYAALAAYLERQRVETHAGLREAARALPVEAEATLASLESTLDLTRLDAETDAALAAALSGLSREHKRPLLLAYLGFPFFDIATLPLLQGEGLDEFDPVRVDRISPDDATAIRGGGAAACLKGIQFHNFGAFFSRAYRENDYLWGRLHGAERLVDIVLSSLPTGTSLGAGRAAAIKRALFHAILDEEADRLTAIPALIAAVRSELGPPVDAGEG
ncbi:patatin [Sphingomonas spermidinifaciens]|uniref:Patatin n=1 Tax=Sphingomonas spermidinifaciens TaxID=1141889 RepID=A0A2A4B1I7_9SPHN|nr:patatin-like protein [Sphingomonas spermidinifaciens]PCD01554.1 patatin [Sphingomonas spermidinifaciens]